MGLAGRARATVLWDEEYWHAIVARQLQSAREAGLLVHLVIYVNMLAIIALGRRFRGGCVAGRGGGGDRGGDGDPLRPYGAGSWRFAGAEAEASR